MGDHKLITPSTCLCNKQSELQCPICDGGLAVCLRCGRAEVELDEPCTIAPCVCFHDEHKPSGQCVTCEQFCGPIRGGYQVEIW